MGDCCKGDSPVLGQLTSDRMCYNTVDPIMAPAGDGEWLVFVIDLILIETL